MQPILKKSMAAAGLMGLTALFGCGSDSASPSVADYTDNTGTTSETVSVCGDYTAFADGLGNTYCMDASGAVVFAVLADGSIVYAESSSASTGTDTTAVVVDPVTGDTTIVTPSSSSTTSAVCGETTSPTSIVGTLYFYSDALGTYYYNIADASCTKVYTSVVSSSSAVTEESSSDALSSSSHFGPGFSSSSEISGTSSAASSSSLTVIEASSSSVSVSNGSEPLVTFSTSGASVENNNTCVVVDGSTVTVTCAGNYYFTGSSNDGQIIVAASTEDKVYLYLNGLTLTSSDAPIYAQSSDKTFIIAVSGTTNTLSDASSRSKVYSYTKNGESKTDTTGAAIYAKDDLTIKGAGTLKVNGNYNNGIQTSNDLKVKQDDELGGSPTLNVTAVNNALKGKGSVEIDGGNITLVSTAGDGIKSDEDDAEDLAEGKGHIEIKGGTINVTAADDGIQAIGYILVDDSVSSPSITVNATGKAMKTDTTLGNIYIYDGTLNLTSTTDDGIHSGNHAFMYGGTVTISSGDDGIHADSNLYLRGSTINVVTSTEAFEGIYIYAEAGITSVYGTDDGWNAAGGAAQSSSTGGSSSFGPGGQQGGGMMSNSWGEIQITGGYHYISASGNDVDVLDANGSAYQTGGVLILEIPTSSQGQGSMGGGSSWGGSSSGCSTNEAGGLIDTDNGYTITGGVLLGFGSQTESYPYCSSTSYTSSNYYGSSNAAFKPQGSGSMIIYGGEVTSVSTVDVSSMTAVNFPNGLTYYYK